MSLNTEVYFVLSSNQELKEITKNNFNVGDVDSEMDHVAENDTNRAGVVALAVKEACSFARSTTKNTSNQNWEAACMMILQNKKLTRSEKSTIISLLHTKSPTLTPPQNKTHDDGHDGINNNNNNDDNISIETSSSPSSSSTAVTSTSSSPSRDFN